jgi:DNA-directed RNA polymerase subunit D
MEVRIFSKDNNRINFLLKGVETPVANALRRIMIAEVPSMVIDDVVIIENSSSMNDEILAHRLGLLPLKTDLDSYVLPENCTCKSELGCSKCSVALTLESEAAGSTRTVYSGELKSDNPDVIPASNNVPLLKLTGDQKIRLEAYARLGRGTTHAKWQPVSASTYIYEPNIQINFKKCYVCEKCVKSCVKQVLKMDGKKVAIVDHLKCNLCNECMVVCPLDAIHVSPVENSFIFTVESVGSLPPERIFLEAANILNDKTEDFISQISSLKEDDAE